MPNEAARFKDFLEKGFQALESRDEEPEEALETGEEEVGEPEPEEPDRLAGIEGELIRIRYMVEDLANRPAPEAPAPPPDRTKEVLAAVAKVEAGTGEKRLLRAAEQVSAMREDFTKLCAGIRERIDDMDAETVLNSFEAYRVDMENILGDAGVYIGPFDYDSLNTLHQRIVGLVPTDDPEKDGMIAERLSDGYKMGDKVLVKERVNVYRYTSEPPAEAGGNDLETPSETASESGEEPGLEEQE